MAAGCAATPDVPSSQGQVLSSLRSAYTNTQAQHTVTASVTETVESGVDTEAEGKGTAVLDFARGLGQTKLTVNGQMSVVAFRDQDKIFEAKSQAALAGKAESLLQVAHRNPDMLPQIQAPGLDPFQLTTLLKAVQWNDDVLNTEPVVVADSSGQHTEYQVTVSTAKLAVHVPAPDRAWLTALSRQTGGSSITLDATVSHGQLMTLAAHFPVPRPKLTRRAAKITAALPKPAPVTVLVTDRFTHSAHLPSLSIPAG
ncbi:hypothetical protein [Streptomyces sp. TRM68367]|uniref:hypothetical protein n=1 Tax=Streptomyces sp. TRM68367 TaxID=2758415 RepID=UPI00165C0ACC|nr:hypothetical protein [Streptomyces sp. TRM68367]MBC9729845.1 hypothetical protein [Streptomyces sp. TRM68367]